MIENSPTAGIMTNSRGTSLSMGGGNVSIQIDYDATAEPVSDIRRNATYGIDLCGPVKLITFSAFASTVVNGVGGCRCRRGAYVEVGGAIGAFPVCKGPGAGDLIDLDDRAPIVWVPWNISSTGLQTLCQVWVNQV